MPNGPHAKGRFCEWCVAGDIEDDATRFIQGAELGIGWHLVGARACTRETKYPGYAHRHVYITPQICSIYMHMHTQSIIHAHTRAHIQTHSHTHSDTLAHTFRHTHVLQHTTTQIPTCTQGHSDTETIMPNSNKRFRALQRGHTSPICLEAPVMGCRNRGRPMASAMACTTSWPTVWYM